MKEAKVIQDVGLGKDGPQVGEVWKLFTRYDYGMRSDHERFTGTPHVNLIKGEDQYPYFTVPETAIERL